MKRSNYLRMLLSVLLLFALLSPVSALAYGDGHKHFKEGMKWENSEDWDKAAAEYALAVSESPRNVEYKLHLARCLFNASQMYMRKGALAAGEKNYPEAYLFFRKAYAFDPTNELAHSEMERMVRLQQELTGKPADPKDGDGLKMVKTGYGGTNKAPIPAPQLPQKLEKLRDLPFPNGIDLQFIIKELAKDLDLNVLFDGSSFRTAGRKTSIELKNVTSAFALDCIFLQEGLFFQKVGPRTILVANSDQRTKFQQLVLRTFYLSNSSPKDIAKVVQTAIPAQPGRSQTIVLTDDATNSVTIRDTAENIRLIGDLIASLDKDRAEVVMDVAIYEVNKSDLLQFGNQLGSVNSSLLNIGGVALPNVNLGSTGVITQGMGFPNIPSVGMALGLPVSNLIALQSKSDTRLIASTQIHAFNNEDSSARIGQRVPVKTATYQTGNTNNSGVVSDVINYEQVGLTLKFKPLVFPNQDVQVAMEIESKDVAGASSLTPTFTERTVKGTARVQNNKTLLLASVASGVETNSRSGLPLIGLIPIIGRLFTAPVNDQRKVDIIIAVTPRVIRAPAILPSDEIERPTGSLAVPTSNSLEAMIIQEEQDELLAAARKVPTNTAVQLEDQSVEAPGYVRTNATQTTVPGKTDAQTAVAANTNTGEPTLKPIDNGMKTLKLNQTANVVKSDESAVETANNKPPALIAELSMQDFPAMKAGTRERFAVNLKGTADFRSAVLGLKFDDKKFAIRSVSLGNVFGTAENTQMTPFLNQNGRLFVSLAAKDGANASANGTLAYIEVEALTDGKPVITFERDVLNFLTTDGKNFAVKLIE